MSKTIEIIEVGPRDGLQNQKEIMATEAKIEMIRRLIDAGARRIEVASFVNPARVPQMADAEAVIAALPDRGDVTTIGLVLNEKGLERALKTKVKEIGVVAIASDGFGIRNQKQTAEESVVMAKAVIAGAKEAGRAAQVIISVAFGCPFAGEVPAARVAEIARRLAEAGPKEIAIADTIGVATPQDVRRVMGAVAAAVPGMPLRVHFHNTRNTGIANAQAALDLGIARHDASAGGIGGCPFAPAATGNIATEDLVYLAERSGYGTGYDLEKLIALAPFISEGLGGILLPAMVSRAGPFPKAAAI